ncbi:MAG: hypothetical protein U1D29_06185, partial [Burkholderiales bacterium]|nr:hypothetical protein [Burkholderiales bacterium]
GDAYTSALRKVYEGRVPGGADLVCYWFEKARTAIETQGLGAAGLVATQAVRAGANRAVLAAICETTKIFDAWNDEAWVNDGAAVRVSLVCFGHAAQSPLLNGVEVPRIPADLSASADGLDLTTAVPLSANRDAAFQGPVKVGAFDIPGSTARAWLALPNVNGKSNAQVLRPWANGQDIAKRRSDTWIIDFGASMPQGDAALFEAPFLHARLHIKPQRDAQNDANRKRHWWIHGRTGDDYRKASASLPRYCATPRVAKHRYFVWLPTQVWPDSRLYAITRADDTTFGILSSRIHEVWSLAQASIHGDGNDGGRPTYNARSCFETFPFPAGLTPADTAHQRTEVLPGGAVVPALDFEQNTPSAPASRSKFATVNIANNTPPATPPTSPPALRAHAVAIAVAARRLNELREAWLNPPEWTERVPEVVPLGLAASPYPDRIVAKPGHEKDLAARTLTQLYNARPAWLAAAHQALDAAVAAAYGWADCTAETPDDEILRRLLALNLARSGGSGSDVPAK